MPAVKNNSNESSKEITVKCPNCQKEVVWNSLQKSKPFCSERCKLIDLGEWAAGEKTIPGESFEAELNVDADSFLH